MATLTEESPEYAGHVSAYLAKSGRRRLPWGMVVAHGALTMTRTVREVHARQELGEVAISLLNALGVTDAVLEQVAALPWTATAEELVAKLQELQETPAPAPSPETTENPSVIPA